MLPGQHDRLELRCDALEHAPLRLPNEELLLIRRLQRIPLDALIAGALHDVLIVVHQVRVERQLAPVHHHAVAQRGNHGGRLSSDEGQRERLAEVFVLVVRGQLEAQLTRRAADLQRHLQPVAVVALPPVAPLRSGVGSRAAQQQPRPEAEVGEVDAAGVALAVDALQLDDEVHAAADVWVGMLALHGEGEPGELGLLRLLELLQLDSDLLHSEDLVHSDRFVLLVLVLVVDTSHAAEAQRRLHLAVGLQRVAVGGEGGVLAAADDELALGVGLEWRVGLALRTPPHVLERLGRLVVAIVLHVQRDRGASARVAVLVLAVQAQRRKRRVRVEGPG